MSTALDHPDAQGSRSGRLGGAYEACLVGLLLAIGGLLAWSPLYGRSGLWAHATIGRWIWQHGQIPDQALFLWTGSDPYVYHSWLAQLILYGITNVGAAEHLPYVAFGFTALLALAPFALIWLVWRAESRFSAWMVIPFLLAFKGLAPRFEPRPELFTGLFLCALLAFLVAWSRASGPIRRRDMVALACIPILFVVWANLHGAVILGLIVLGITAGCDLLQDWFVGTYKRFVSPTRERGCTALARRANGERFSPRARWLAVVTPLALAAICFNPYGIAYLQTYGRVQSFTFAQIIEWRPIWHYPSVVPEILPTVAVVAALAALAWLLNPQRRWAHLGWLLVLGVLFAQARRNVWPFTLAALTVLAANAPALSIDAIWRRLSQFSTGQPADEPAVPPRRWRLLFRAGVLVWLGLEAANLAMDLRPGRPLLPAALEQGVVGFIRAHDLGGRLLNDYETSGYLQWALAGQPPLYLDRMDSYPDEVMRDYQDMVQMTAHGGRVLDRRQIEVVVLATNRGAVQSLAPLAAFLDTSPRWARVFANKAGVIWVRRLPAYAPLWQANHGVSQVEFRTLERFAEEDQTLVPAIVEDIGDGRRRGNPG